MKSKDGESSLFQWLFRREDGGRADAARRFGGGSGEPVQALDVFFLVDPSTFVDRQILLLAIDALAHFAGGGERPLRVKVVHRAAVDEGLRACFDQVPGLDCVHATLSANSAPDLELAMGHRWREYAALAVARSTQAPFYLVMDESCICVRPLLPAALVAGERALSQWEAIDRHPENLAASLTLLHTGARPGQGLSTLPTIFSTALALRTLQRVADASPSGSADSKLAAASAAHEIWSANSLYSMACLDELPDQHRVAHEDGAFAALHGDANIWDDDTPLEGWDPVDWVRKATHGQFIVVKTGDPDRARTAASLCYGLLR